KQNKKGVSICAICTGTFLLAEAGILAGRSCTTHWKRIKSFKNRFPTIDVKENRLFVADGNVYTSAGISAGIDLALYLLEKKFGSKLALDVAKEAVIYFRRGGADPQLSIFLQYRNHLDERVHRAQTYIAEHLAEPFRQTDIARHVNMSLRNLTRAFKASTGITILAYTKKLRVEKAQQLLAEKNKMEMVATACGLKSVSQLRRMLREVAR
ncbi:MAG: helix-turn-helix domain-containing protein, partial [Bacteroidota bacterium]